MSESDETWGEAFSRPRYRISFITTAILAPILTWAFGRLVHWVEDRPGALIDDPLLRLFEPVDVNWITFVLIYSGLLLGIVTFARRPGWLLLAGQSYLILLTLRGVMMWAIPLDPPELMIPLRDPFVQALVGSREILTRDLFFSGHTMLPALCCFVASERGVRIAFAALTVLIGALVLVQHVHYTVDVLVAPVAAWGALSVGKLLRRRTWAPA